MDRFSNIVKEYYVHTIFLISLAAMLGSLYMSEVEQYAPCPLCWWARVWMYPIVIIAAVGIILNDKKTFWYIAPLSIIGTLFSLYHNMLQIGIFTESEACVAGGTSCATPTIAFTIGEAGVSLELLGLLGFLAINIVLITKALVEFKK